MKVLLILTSLFMFSVPLQADCGREAGAKDKGCSGGCHAGKQSESCGGGLTAPDGQVLELTLPKEAWIRLWMDELAARDLYAALEPQTTRPVFNNIGRAEVRHRDMIASLLQAAGETVPEEPEAGAYPDKEITSVYTALLNQGQISELEAFKAGAAFEELDISELEREMARESLSEQERQLLTSLRDASVRHLRAFRRQITRLGEEPVPTHLSRERIEALLSGKS
jgi:hypothetical protein